jgi:hypothetical protein
MRSLPLIAIIVAQSVLAADKHLLEFIGNKAFTTPQLHQALTASDDYTFVSHPLANKEAFQKNLSHLLQIAYADRGYVKARVTVAPPINGKWQVRIEERNLFKCGKVIVPAKNNPLAKQLVVFLSKAIEGYDPTTNNPNNSASLDKLYQPADWITGQTACLTRARLEALGWNARLFCFLKGYTQAKAILLPKPRENGTIDMEVQMVLGKKQFGTDVKKTALKLGQVQVHGSAANKPEDILTFLGLRSGMPTTPSMCRDSQKTLWDSGRFLAVSVAWRKDEEKETVGMDIHVTECPNVPLLRESLPERTRKALAIYRSLMTNSLGAGGEWELNLMINASETKDLPLQLPFLLSVDRTVQLRVVFAADKGMGIALRSVTGKEPEALRWGLVSLTGKETGIFRPGNKVKWVAPDEGKTTGAIINLSITPPENPGGTGRFNIGGGFSTDQPVPLKFNVNFPPAAILAAFHNENAGKKFKLISVESTTLDDGIKFDHFTLSYSKTTDNPIHLKFHRDAQFQFLSMQMEMEYDGAKIDLKLSRAKNALNELADRLTKEARTHSNQYNTDHGLSTLFGFVGTHIFPAIAKLDLLPQKNKKPNLLNRVALEAQVQLLKTLGPQLQKALEPLDGFISKSPNPFEIRQGIFQDQLAPPKVTVDGNTKQIPLGKGRWSISSPHADTEFDFQMREEFDLSSLSSTSLASMVFMILGPILADDAWPKVINREYESIQIYSTQYTEAALLQMVETEKGGPLACLMAANLLNLMDLPGGIRCAQAGLERLNEKGVRLDYQPFTDPNSPMIRATDHFLETANPVLVKKIVDGIGVELLGKNQNDELLKNLAANEKIKSTEILGPVIVEVWKKLIPMIANELQMAQFGSMRHIRTEAASGNAEYQFILGLMYFQGRGVTVDLVESFAWASHSARKNYPDATNLRTAIMRQMTPEEILRGMKRTSEIK